MTSEGVSSPLVGIGQDCLVVLDPKVMTPDEADALALALIRAADRCRRADDAVTPPARTTSSEGGPADA